MKKITIIGCGAIGSEISFAIDKKIINMELVNIYDIDKEKMYNLKKKLKNINPKICKNLKEAIHNSDLIFEAASISAVKSISKECFVLKKDLFIMSVGALIVYPEILKLARKYNCKIFFSSGAASGFDGIKASKLSGIKSLVLTTRKPPESLKDSPGLNKFLKKHKKNIYSITEPEIIFKGNVKQAIKLFPQNINISALLAVSVNGTEKITVKIIADPFIDKNIHEIKCISNSGIIYTKTENVPHPQNPKTSYLAILSAITKLKEIEEN